ncbi:RsmB/NOP family class I SAM-dependent RNA methyltransferase [Sphingobium sp. 3R8]|uniref:rRNA cytosine-C5-methylase n=1 Tax=Sphingomonas bisphenolicum TaxID=296544 RepID=A0ABN5WBS9_9SPHN|nr:MULTISPECIES: RsmB/NOP family class I SAM-dependent RNA methyltransferase [Sphingomonadaceae]MBZ9646945.1 RsmB/NOP family class I SAM-dependent RNA methyltransferase [Sphingobium sp. 3R8]BBF69318.1 rRNA cytosine-C5-methylase [Sphingomonas bisphenolicum]
MTPSARIQAAIDLLDAIIASARDGGPAADTLIARYFKERRYAGSRDRRAVRDHVYDAIRRAAERPETGREAMIGLALERPEVAALFDGSTHAPLPIEPGEMGAEAGAVPRWLQPLLADKVEQDALLGRAPVDVRVNRLKATPPDVAPLLPDATPIAGLPDGLRLPEGFPVEQQAAWKDGLVEVQDAGSQWIAAACAVQPGMTVIDLCAGAGGKTLALAAAMGGRGNLIAADTIRSRLARLEPRAARAGATFIETLLLDQSHEARGLESLNGQVDVVLVDAPCSGTGTWRRNPEARWRLTQPRLDRLVAEQARILDFAASLLAPGGALVYATCALTEREGRGQVDAFLARHAGWTAEPIALPVGRAHGAGLLLTPGHDGSDGFFFARLRREA